MHKEEFERDMEEYLHARKRAGFNFKDILKKFLPEKKKEHVELPEQVEVYEEEAKTEPKEGMLAKLFKKEEPLNEELLRTKMQVEDMSGDMKEISKIALSVVKQLPDEQLRTFKESPDFEKLKIILKKHDLIK